MLNMSKFLYKKYGSLTTKFVDSKLKNQKIYSLAMENSIYNAFLYGVPPLLTCTYMYVSLLAMKPRCKDGD